MNNNSAILSTRARARYMAVCLLTLGVLGCGQSGPLYLPKDPAPTKAKLEPVKPDGKGDANTTQKPDSTLGQEAIRR